MLMLAATALAADLCAALSQNVRAAPASFGTAAPLPGATCTVDGAGYTCVFPVKVEDDRFPQAWEDVNARVGACRLGAMHAEVSDDPERIYLPSTWTSASAQIEVRVAEPGTGIQVRVTPAPKS